MKKTHSKHREHREHRGRHRVWTESGHLLARTKAAGIDPARLIVEVGEHTPASDQKVFTTALRLLRDHGIAIAVDDVGFGHSNYKMILDCHPEYLKIDRYFVHGASRNPGKMIIVRSILELARCFGAIVIAEGVEDSEDHEALSALGIDLFQGFLFSRPAAVDSPAFAQAIGRSMRASTGF